MFCSCVESDGLICSYPQSISIQGGHFISELSGCLRLIARRYCACLICCRNTLLAFLAEILSPKVLEARVLSPKVFTLQILSPIIGSPRVNSPESMGILVLSPSILSPHVMSDGCLNVEVYLNKDLQTFQQVLSPHLLSGRDGNEYEYHHCCKFRNRCCHKNKRLPKHEANPHFNQFVHSKSVPTPSGATLPKNDHQTTRNRLPTLTPSLTKLISAIPSSRVHLLQTPYAFWPRKPPTNPIIYTTNLMARQPSKRVAKAQLFQVPVSKVLMPKQQMTVG